VQLIQQAVIAYYSQFEEPSQGDAAPEQNQPEAEPAAADLSASAEEAAEMPETEETEIEAKPAAGAQPEDFESGSEQELSEAEAPAEHGGTIEDAGSPTSKDTPEEGHGS
jgi:hypothetical protein